MKIKAPFLQLPLVFDAEAMAAEIEALGPDGWLPHPTGYAGNDFLPLISVDGEPHNESFRGPMQPTSWLAQCPYLVQVLAALGATLGRTRLMRLSGQAEVTPHVDLNYYWHQRMRVHLPVVTQPTVRFICGVAEINMKAGECWLFDTWSRHRVLNDADRPRIHLVADTVGGEGFWDLFKAARPPGEASAPDWTPRNVEPDPDAASPVLAFESVNLPTVMTPWEVRDHFRFLYGELTPNQVATAAVFAVTSRFMHVWTGLWAQYGEDRAGWPSYRRALDQFKDDLDGAAAGTLALKNGMYFLTMLTNLVIKCGLADQERA